jgi:hypothetical protein
MTAKPDDLEAVRTLVSTLEPFDAETQERIIRWAREKMGRSIDNREEPGRQEKTGQGHGDKGQQIGGQHSQDIKTFITAKNPGSDVQLAATVAYFYRFEAPESKRKDTITAEDLQEACRMIGRTGKNRLTNPGQTLRNAHNLGLLDRSGEPGVFSVNTVGENLVAMTLPSSPAQASLSKKKPQKKRKRKEQQKKKVAPR